MKLSKDKNENEIKLAVRDVRSIRRNLKAAGFEITKPRVFEVNLVFDTPQMTLRKNSRLLRLRKARTATLTYKGAPLGGKHKQREELEVEVSNLDDMKEILERLGYQHEFRYEKYRTEFQEPGRRGVVMLDETPVGVFLELEGTPHWIDRTARRLNFNEDAYITVSYGRLYLEWCAAHGIKPADMVFR